MVTKATLSQGFQYLATPGPSVMPEAVLQAMHRPSPNIYEGELIEMTSEVIADLKGVARTSHDLAIYIGNGHAAWEAALANVVSAGDKVLVTATGQFGHGWAGMATGLGADVSILDFGLQDTVDMARLEDALKSDKSHEIKAVMVTHVDTSTSVWTDVAAVRQVMDAVGHPALLMADCVASLGCDRFEMDAWGVDVMVSGSQKGLMVPPGLGLVYFSPKAAEVRAKMDRVSNHWDWTPRANPELYYQHFNGTAPTQHIYGMRVALDMMKAEGLENIWARHDCLARAIWAAADVWQQGGAFSLQVPNPANRSRAVTVLHLTQHRGTDLRQWTQNQIGLTLGIGLGMSTDDDPKGDGFFRFGHMGYVNGHMIMGLLGGVEAGLRALSIPIGEGALSAAAKVIAGHAPANAATVAELRTA